VTKFQTVAEDFACRILRRYWTRWSERQKVLKRCFHRQQGRRFIYKCEICGAEKYRTELQIHHAKREVIDPVEGWRDMNEFVSRLFCKAEDLLAICVPCHNFCHRNDAKTRAKSSKERQRKSSCKGKK
jgi:hypothetical protein